MALVADFLLSAIAAFVLFSLTHGLPVVKSPTGGGSARCVIEPATVQDDRNVGLKNSVVELPDNTFSVSAGVLQKRGRSLKETSTEVPESSPPPTESSLGYSPAVSQSKIGVNGSHSDRDRHRKFSAFNVSPGPRSSPTPTESPVVSQSKIAVNGSISRRGGHAQLSDSVVLDSSGGIPCFPSASSNVLITLFYPLTTFIFPFIWTSV